MIATPIPQPIADPVSRWNDWPQLAPETLQFVNRLFTPPTRAREAIYDTFIRALVSSGVWTKLDCLYLFAASDEGAALTNVKQDNFRAYRDEPAGTVTWTANGGYSSGSVNKHINSGFNPTTASSPNFTRNDAMVFAWSGTTTQINIEIIQTGVVNQQLAGTNLYPKWSDGKPYTSINSSADFGTAHANDSSGLYLAQRTASDAAAVYRNGVSLSTSSAASAAIVNSSIYYMCMHTTRIGGIGRSLSAGELTALYDACAAYLTSVVGSVP